MVDFLASLAGLEPATHSLEGCCSFQLSYRPVSGGEPVCPPPRELLERVMGIEPTQSAWKAEVLPLNYTRMWFLTRLPNDFTATLLVCKAVAGNAEGPAAGRRAATDANRRCGRRMLSGRSAGFTGVVAAPKMRPFPHDRQPHFAAGRLHDRSSAMPQPASPPRRRRLAIAHKLAPARRRRHGDLL